MLWIAACSMSGNKKGVNEESVLEKLYDKNMKRSVQTSRRNWRSDKFNKASKIRGTTIWEWKRKIYNL